MTHRVKLCALLNNAIDRTFSPGTYGRNTVTFIGTLRQGYILCGSVCIDAAGRSWATRPSNDGWQAEVWERARSCRTLTKERKAK